MQFEFVDREVDGADDSGSVASNAARDTNTRPTDEMMSGNISMGIVETEVEDEAAGDDVGNNVNTNSIDRTQPTILHSDTVTLEQFFLPKCKLNLLL